MLFSLWIRKAAQMTLSAMTVWITCTTCVIYMLSESHTPIVLFLSVTLFLSTVTLFTTNYKPKEKQTGSNNSWPRCHYLVLICKVILSSPAFAKQSPPTHCLLYYKRNQIQKWKPSRPESCTPCVMNSHKCVVLAELEVKNSPSCKSWEIYGKNHRSDWIKDS